jgi:hypothetical protein
VAVVMAAARAKVRRLDLITVTVIISDSCGKRVLPRWNIPFQPPRSRE